MKVHFLLTVDLPEWGATPQQMEWIRFELEEHAGAAAALYTKATHVTSKCEVAEAETDRLGVLHFKVVQGGEGARPLSEYKPTGP